jgi:hypothetical protein
MPEMPGMAPMPPMEGFQFELGPEFRESMEGVRMQLERARPQLERIGPELRMQFERMRPQLERLRMELPRIAPRMRMGSVIV